MQEIQAIVNKKVNEMIEDGSIVNSINENIQKAITSAIESQFKSYGSITKQIEDALKDGLQINTQELPFETYNQQMLVAVKAKLGNMFHGLAAERFLSEIDKTLAPVPKELSIKDLVETVVKSWKTDEPWDADDLDQYATVEIRKFEHSDKSHTLKMWKQKEVCHSISHRTNSPDLELFFINGVIRISHKQTYNPTCFHEHEAFIFKLYAAGTTVTGIEDFDPDYCDLTLKEFD
ncbi:hypothetical protein [Methylotenera sp.]|uniref:hypothetical protein n=1 Tax=Methylotenera sp. TaxID=2051956 RepID=UPI002ED886B6